MGGYSRNHHANSLRAKSSRLQIFALFALALFSLTALLLFKVDQTRTVAGHNLEPTPWHLFPPKQFNDGSRYTRTSKIIECSYLTCRRHSSSIIQKPRDSSQQSPNSLPACPSFFRWIHQDLEPWKKSRISVSTLMEARQFAAFRVTIVGGRLYADFYYACVQSRAMFTIWGLLQLLRRYPGLVPDVDLMFDCMDRPVLNRTVYSGTNRPPPPLFRYCTTKGHFDIPFPDWSFWGWPEVNIENWDDEFRSIKQGSQATPWTKKWPRAYWKGNPDVDSPVREELMRCNHSRFWGAQIMRQNWLEEARGGFEQSKLSNQCKHRYKIYAEGFAWSVSLKYILSCGSLTLIIAPQYEDFFSRGLAPRENYWPIYPTTDLCRSIKFAVDWGNRNPSEAGTIGRGGQDFMEELPMDRVYDYMFHLINEYSKLQDFKPFPPSSAQEVCMESLLCYADPKQREFLEKSTASPSSSYPCTLPPADRDIISSWIQKRQKIISDLQKQEKMRAM
ncbi:Lipopolysaccharide-modifying protein [Macleaya cordata]|uniref:Lipopolysaccharide-modifying protein n=1 Tax=Macleaya cordata TaxID=56857 RepID=A0A200PLK9_MACCD|nr:Lipopolysaccharide-modifying protein [Macleaya cordata]